MYFYTSLSSYNYCPLARWVNMQEWWVNITGINTILQNWSIPVRGKADADPFCAANLFNYFSESGQLL